MCVCVRTCRLDGIAVLDDGLLNAGIGVGASACLVREGHAGVPYIVIGVL